MALTCSVLGHAFGDPTTERDREERGSEVVVTVREYETCRRCGTTRVVSENKEVTAVEGEAAPITDRRTDIDVADEGGSQPPVDGAPDDGAPAAGDPSTAPAEGTPADEGAAAATEPAAEADVASGADAEPAAADADDGDDGAEIMDAEAGEPVDEELASPSVADPAEADVAGGADAEPTEDEDAVVMGESDDGEDRAPGEWPEEDEPDTPEWSPPDEDSEAEQAPDVDHSPGHTITVPDGEFHCEECGYSTPVESSSLRAGDFCPECHRGTLSHVREE